MTLLVSKIEVDPRTQAATYVVLSVLSQFDGLQELVSKIHFPFAVDFRLGANVPFGVKKTLKEGVNIDGSYNLYN